MKFKWHWGARAVLVAGPLTFKFPRFIISAFVSDFLFSIKNRQTFLIYLAFIRFWETIKENVREASWAFKAQRPSFLVPCMVPLIFVNVYPTVSGVGKLKMKKYWYALYEERAAHRTLDDEFHRLLTNGGCDHTFKYEDNFAITDTGDVKMLDYGALDVKELLERYPEKVRDMLLTASKEAR